MDINDAIQLAYECYQKGDLQQAEQICREIIKIQPNNAGVYNNLGVILYEERQLDEAIKCYQKALELNPNLFDVYFNLGNVFKDKGQLDKSLYCYQKVLHYNPNSFDSYIKIGIAFQAQGLFDEAITCYQKALQLNPDNADVFYNLGISYQKKHKLDEAINCYQKALQRNPNCSDLYNSLGFALIEKGDTNGAVAHFQKALDLNPSNAMAYSNMGNVLKENGQLQEAITCYQKALQLNPNLADAYDNLGLVLMDVGNLDEAITCFRKAIQLSPRFAKALNNLGNAFQYGGQWTDALDCYEKTLEIDSNLSDAKWNIGLIELTFGNFEKGWKHYEYRWEIKKIGLHKRDFTRPIWDGSSLKSKKLLIYAEQGVGDEIMFASCFHDAIEKAHDCIIECDKRLVPIFMRSFAEATIIERLNADDYAAVESLSFDKVIPIGSLPLYFRSSLSNFPSRKYYLIPNGQKVDIWKKRFNQLGEGIKVGISWRGGEYAYIKQIRSTALTQWAEIFSIPGVYFINLQYGDVTDELQQLRDTLGIIIYDWEDADPLKDLDNFAAEISSLDLVISIDNSTVHMAGALGVPVWTLLSYVHDWRWMLNRDDSPWYPSMKLFRQSSFGDWESVIAKVKDELMNLLSTN